MAKKQLLLVTVILGLFGIIYGQTSHQVVWPGKEWGRSTPQREQLDAGRLEVLVKLIREGQQYPDLHSLLVVRNGFLVVEEYFNQRDANEIHTLQSVSKSFTSALVGIAINRGDIKGVRDKLLAYFKEKKAIKHVDKRKRSITLKDLLTMRSGTDYHENNYSAPHFQLNRLQHGWDDFYLNRPMVSQPGSRFQYDSGAVIVTSAVLKNASGLHADGYAQKHLFPKIGIQKSSWFRNSDGHPHTGGGLHLRSQDMARFGLLYLRKGRWQTQQVVPESWVEESIKTHVSFNHGSRRHVVGYGYWWWVLEPDPQGHGKENIFAAMGFMAQYIFVIPEHSMVVVVTGGTHNGGDQRKPIQFLYSHILPAVLRK